MTLTVTNRDLLRRFKELKEQLLTGQVDEILVIQKNDMVLKLHIVRELTPMQKLLKMVKEKPILNVERSDQDIF